MDYVTFHNIFVASSEGGTVEAHHPMLPETKEIIGGGLAFLLVVILLAWKAGPAGKKALRARTDRIAAEVNTASARRAAAETALEETRAKLANIDTETAEIVAEARKSAETLRKSLAQQGSTELIEYRDRTAAELAAARDRVIADIKAEATAHAVERAGRVIRGALDDNLRNSLVDHYIAELANA